MTYISGNEKWINGRIIKAENLNNIEEALERQASKIHNAYLTCSEEWLKKESMTNKVILNEKCITQNLFNIFAYGDVNAVLTMIDITDFIESNQLNILKFKSTSMDSYEQTVDLTQENIVKMLSSASAKTGENNTEVPRTPNLNFFATDERGIEYSYCCKTTNYSYYFIKKENRYYIALTGYTYPLDNSPGFYDIKQPYNIRFDTANFNVISKPLDIELSYFVKKDLLSIE